MTRPTTISVVVPLYNKRGEIGRCIESIAAQTVPPDEVIVVDDGSTDGSRDVAAATPCPALRVISQQNQGECAARNTGIQAAKGSLVAFLDADDEWRPEFLSEIVRLQRTFPQAGAYSTAYTIDKGRFGEYDVTCDLGSELALLAVGEGFRDWFTAPAAMWSSSSAVRKHVFDTVGMFRPGIRQGGDLDMWFRIACVYPIAYSRAPRAIWHWTAGNRSTGLAPNEEDFIGASLKEMIDRGLVSEETLRRAQAYSRKLNFKKARDIARWDHAKGIQALKAWRDANGATLKWYLHYIPLACHPKPYWSALYYGAMVKGAVRTLLTRLKASRATPQRAGVR